MILGERSNARTPPSSRSVPRALATGDPADAYWTDSADRAVLATVDALHQRADLDDAEWRTLLDAVGEDAAVDLLLLCGWYHAISFVVNALRLPAEPGTRPSGQVTMITVIAHYTAAAGAADAVRQLLARHAAASRAEPGVLTARSWTVFGPAL